MGGGLDAASEVANVVLMGDHLHQVRVLFHLPFYLKRGTFFWCCRYWGGRLDAASKVAEVVLMGDLNKYVRFIIKRGI